jgi:very-short-patch-repair endonuclease
MNDLSQDEYENLLINKLASFDFKSSTNKVDQWGLIRQLYMENIPYILKVSKKNIKKWSSAYYFDWKRYLTPIEQIAWDSIRVNATTVLYPQFPVFNYFIDFANPYLKIGLELDGEKYHNYEKDLVRDKLLNRYGWKIFRVKGFETKNTYLNRSEIEEKELKDSRKRKEIENWILNTCDGLISSINYRYFLNDEERERKSKIFLTYDDEEDYVDFSELTNRSLKKHRIIDFRI